MLVLFTNLSSEGLCTELPNCFCNIENNQNRQSNNDYSNSADTQHRLTQTCVNEPVPNAPRAPDQPAPLGAGCEAERGPQHADQQVAHRDAHQKQVHGRAQSPEPAEEREHQEVREQTKGADEAQAQRHHQVPGGAQGRRGRSAVLARGHLTGTARAARALVGNDHAVLSRGVWTSGLGDFFFFFSRGQLIWRSEGARTVEMRYTGSTLIPRE